MKVDLKKNTRKRLCQLNNLVTFRRKPMGFEEFFNRMVEALGKLNHRKNKMCFYLNVKA